MRLIKTVICLLSGIVVLGLEAQTLNHDASDGTITYSQKFNSGSNITITGGDPTFTGVIRSNSSIFVSGGNALFSGDLQNNVSFSLTGGTTTINSLKNNANINVDGGTLLLNEPIGNNASVSATAGGTVELGTDDVFANNTNVTLDGATLDTNSYNFAVDSVTLNGNSTLDLGDAINPSIDLGVISGTGNLTIVNYSPDTVITYDQTASENTGFTAGTQITFDGAPPNTDPNIVSPPVVPETGTMVGLSLLLAIGLGYHRFKIKQS